MPKLNRYQLSELLMSIYDHGTSPNALKEADVILEAFEESEDESYQRGFDDAEMGWR